MSSIPHKQSLVVQTVAWINSEINRGAWSDWLPGERILAGKLQMSRNTLRAAIEQLISDGTLRAEHGLGNRILRKPAAANAGRQRTVGLLTPDALEQLRPSQTLWIDQLRVMLTEHNCVLDVVHGHQYFQRLSSKALAGLTSHHRYSCWLLMRSNETTQNWFQKHKVPAVVAGSIGPNIDLPFVDIDHRALCRHAAATLLRAGHRCIALVAERTGRAGDAESELGFIEGVQSSSHRDAEHLIAWHGPTAEDVCASLDRLLRQRRSLTAVLIANPLFYLTAATHLAKRGARVPEDVSLVSRDYDTFLAYVVPRPAHYTVPPSIFAKKLLKPILRILDGTSGAIQTAKLVPAFVPGPSLRSIRS